MLAGPREIEPILDQFLETLLFAYGLQRQRHKRQRLWVRIDHLKQEQFGVDSTNECKTFEWILDCLQVLV